MKLVSEKKQGKKTIRIYQLDNGNRAIGTEQPITDGYWKTVPHKCPDGLIRNVPQYFLYE